MLSEYKDLLENNPISIATSDGERPNIAVASDVAVVSDDQLLISHNEMVKTVANIMTHNKICMTCFDKNWYGARIYGEAEYFNDGEWFERVKKLFTNKRTEPKGAILVTTGKIEKQS
ncbi:MAG: pyridoxamine 5'-phosphate oxidase family protein [Candidatus Nomurabacteria bacterium]|jgi:uncharacterized pyridoxamine 5'-phosphate oxidase family protein|nr:pyridoxamine 5'-phosphate oxidase family protein [Candidatus Nomurabacteria bacterium]